MIGSQATKGMHVLVCFAPKIVECGVWSDGGNLTTIEAYPALTHADCEDVLTCAVVASLFAKKQAAFTPPEADVSLSEDWIWAPRYAFVQDTSLSS